ncbi:arsenate reductase (thioredoxin) [Lactococcus lactis]|uniref:arsenate reductase (thioredoxin) n=1 Tax=Lactococcus lactis TaxID=1358 RepID=UPI0021AF7686|nr:arsenate reductase (thioredoxin) [Lactococcus lactis]MCT1227406.1 arsenate reductase (thioredoxin) [Lactococcus lactis]
MKKVYFLCTGNSCRSQMAEGYGHKFLRGWEVRSAGIEMHGLNSRAVQVMAEDGIDISSQQSELINIEYFNESDLIVTLCGDVLDKCPMIPKEINHEHWNLEDPARALGTEVEILEEFRKTRDLIKEQVKLIGK